MNSNETNSYGNNFNTPNSNLFNMSSSETTPFANDENFNMNLNNNLNINSTNNNNSNTIRNNNNNNNSSINNNNNNNNNFDITSSGSHINFNNSGYDWDQINNFIDHQGGDEIMPYIPNENDIINKGFKNFSSYSNFNNAHIDDQNGNNNNDNNMMSDDLNFDNFDKDLINNLVTSTYDNNNDDAEPVSISLNDISISLPDVDTLNRNADSFTNDSYQSVNSLSASLKAETFSPQSLGFSKNFTNNRLGTSISNTLAKSYGSQLGASLNNLISPTSTYDGYSETPYGSYNDESLNSPINSPSFKSIGSPSSSLGAHLNPKSALSKESKLSRRRELHNAVERRRRDLIKEKIKELGLLIPPTMLYDNSKSKNSNKDVKANKNIILNKSVEYITHLKRILDAQDERLLELHEQINFIEKNKDNAEYNSNHNYYANSNNDTPSTNNNFNDEKYNIQMSNMDRNMNVDTDLNDFQKNLSAFSEGIDIKSSNSKLRFMDFSDIRSEPLDFNKLSESLSKSTSNQGNIDSLLGAGTERDTPSYSNNNFDEGLSFEANSYNNNNNNNNYNSNNNNNNNNNPMNQMKIRNDGKNGQPDAGNITSQSPNDDFNQMLSEPTFKFESDPEFLNHLLSKDNFGI